MRRYQVTDAALHDSQFVDDILDPDNMASEVWADSAYRSAEIEAKLEAMSYLWLAVEKFLFSLRWFGIMILTKLEVIWRMSVESTSCP